MSQVLDTKAPFDELVEKQNHICFFSIIIASSLHKSYSFRTLICGRSINNEILVIECGAQSVRYLADLSSYSNPGRISERREHMAFYKTFCSSFITFDALDTSL